MVRRLLTRLKERSAILNYGRDIVAAWGGAYVRHSPNGSLRALDLGCGRHATDLLNLRVAAGARQLELFGVEYHAPSALEAQRKGVHVFALDIERDPLPAADASFDIVIANQVIEHTKELFWIFSEIARVLRPGGLLIVGVPNLASLHNRVLLLFGEQPSAIETLGPHVRGFTAPALRRFIEVGGFFKVVAVRGANFYPFPPAISRPLSRLLPTLSVGLFVAAVRQQTPGAFISALDARYYETAYYRGKKGS